MEVYLYFDIPIRSPANRNPISYTTITCLYHMVSLWIKDLLLCFDKTGFFQFMKWHVLLNMEQSKQTCFHVILCEMNYVLNSLHYAVISHNKILTRKPILMQITVKRARVLQTLKLRTNARDETELVLIRFRAKELADRPPSCFVPRKENVNDDIGKFQVFNDLG